VEEVNRFFFLDWLVSCGDGRHCEVMQQLAALAPEVRIREESDRRLSETITAAMGAARERNRGRRVGAWRR
jgi:hypothetical protein